MPASPAAAKEFLGDSGEARIVEAHPRLELFFEVRDQIAQSGPALSLPHVVSPRRCGVNVNVMCWVGMMRVADGKVVVTSCCAFAACWVSHSAAFCKRCAS